jgi:NUDIX domain
MAEVLLATSGETCHINGIRIPLTLAHILQKHRALIAAVVSDDATRRERVTRRARHSDTPLSYEEFLANEHKENSYPNQQNIDLLLAFADVHIPNKTTTSALIDHGNDSLYEALRNIDHQPESTTHIDAFGYRHFARGIIHNEHNEILLVYDHAKARYLLPGGKCDAGETPDLTIIRELFEEV